MAYGTSAGVAALAKTWSQDGDFYDAVCLDCLIDQETNPTLTEVNTWLEQLSDTMDVSLAGEGFVIPVTQAKCVNLLTMMIQQFCADLVNAANGAGRFFTERALQAGAVPMMVIRKEIKTWANENAGALEAAGATRIQVRGDSIITKTNHPIFHREAFGNAFQDWSDTTDD